MRLSVASENRAPLRRTRLTAKFDAARVDNFLKGKLGFDFMERGSFVPKWNITARETPIPTNIAVITWRIRNECLLKETSFLFGNDRESCNCYFSPLAGCDQLKHVFHIPQRLSLRAFSQTWACWVIEESRASEPRTREGYRLLASLPLACACHLAILNDTRASLKATVSKHLNK